MTEDMFDICVTWHVGEQLKEHNYSRTYFILERENKRTGLLHILCNSKLSHLPIFISFLGLQRFRRSYKAQCKERFMTISVLFLGNHIKNFIIVQGHGGKWGGKCVTSLFLEATLNNEWE
jgi:hypothetical protein